MSLSLRFFLSISALCLGLGILGVSLFYGSSQSFSISGETGTLPKELYFDEDLLPDHVLYPVLMAVDRVRLESAPELEQLYLRTEYANRRLQYTQDLLDKDKTELAYTTLTKSQKYLLYAAQDMLSYSDLPENSQAHVLRTIQYHQEKNKALSSHFSDQQRSDIDMFLMESQALLDQL